MSFLKRRKQRPASSAAEAPTPRQPGPTLQHSQLGHDLGQLLAQGEGLRYLARLITLSGALGPSYSAAGAEATAYNEGLRRMGLFILAEVEEHAPALLPRLVLLCLPGSSAPSGPPIQ